MAKKLYSPTSLTQFAPLSPENDSRSFSIQNFFKKGKAKDSSQNLETVIVEKEMSFVASGSKDVSEDSSPISSCQSSISTNFPVNVENIANRNMSSVLEMVRNIVEGKKMELQRYKDSDFKQYWMPDSNCKECYECGDKFTTFRRRHHCRICGQIFCRRCCNQGIPGSLIGYSGDLRVCNYCFKMISSCMQSLDSESEISDELQTLHDLNNDLNTQHLSERVTNAQPNVSSARRKSSVMGFREEDIAKAKPSKTSLESFCQDFEYSGSKASSDSVHHDKTFLSDLYNKLSFSEGNMAASKNKGHSQYQYVSGSNIVNKLLNCSAAMTRSDAINIGQAFLDAAFLECFDESRLFFDNDVLYKVKMSGSKSESNHETMEPLWVKEIQNTSSERQSISEDTQSIDSSPSTYSDLPRSRSRIPSSSSSFYLDLDVRESTVKISKPPNTDKGDSKELTKAIEGKKIKPKEPMDSSNAYNGIDFHGNYLTLDGFHDSCATELEEAFNAPSYLFSSCDSSSLKSCQLYFSDQLKEKNKAATADQLNARYKILENDLLRQLLENDGLMPSWSDIILPIVQRVIDVVHPDVKNDADSMDIRQYVQIKKIPGGIKSESSIVNGVVFSKTVAHKKMQQYILQPTVLLLTSPITYQRTENKFSSLDPVIMQEFEYLKNTVGKLTVCKPSVLLVEKSVSRLAQEMLLSLGITVVLNVKQTVMERVARCTQAAVVSTVDAHLGKPQLGCCQNFKVKTFNIPGGKNKTLIYFDGCPTKRGCTILLRGGQNHELKKVKQIVQFMLYVRYNWRLEHSFLMDEFATLPPSKSDGLLDSLENEETCVSSTHKNKIEKNSESTQIPKETKDIILKEISNKQRENNNNDEKADRDDCSKRLEAKCIDDFSDPLHLYMQADSDVFSDDTNFQVSSMPSSNTFRRLLDDTILCCSLNVKINLPYLETETGKQCALRKFFPQDVYWSPHFMKEKEEKKIIMHSVNFDDENEQTDVHKINNNFYRNVEITPMHLFVPHKITDISPFSMDVHSLLSDYRARGGTIRYMCAHQINERDKQKKSNVFLSQTSVDKDAHKKMSENNANTGLCWERKIDVLDPYNHQKLAVLFYSYSCSSNNAPNFCVNPWVVKMDFYGTNDIPLGGFLEKYCFRSTYVCPSSSCYTQMTEHVRKFVHGTGCVHILLLELRSPVQAADNNILMWSWCNKCKQASPVVPMSQETWSFSFAKYLELKFYAPLYIQRSSNLCSHSLHHDHYQYFVHKQTVAIFQYNTITVWEIALPSIIIHVHDEIMPISEVVDEIKSIAIKGSEFYNIVVEKLIAFKQQYMGTSCEEAVEMFLLVHKLEMSSFREKIEQIQLRLTSPTLEAMQKNGTHLEKTTDKNISSAMWKIEDQMNYLKYYLIEAVNSWNTRIQDFISARKKEEKQSSKEKAQLTKEEEMLTNNSTSSAPVPDNSSNVAKVCHCSSSYENANVSKFLRSQKMCNPPSIERSFSCESISDSLRTLRFKPRLFRSYSEPTKLSCIIDKKTNIAEDAASNCSSASSYTYGITTGIYAGLMVPQPEDNETYVVCHKDNCVENCAGLCTASRGHERSKSEGHQALTDTFKKTSQEKEENAKTEKKERGTVKALISQFLSSSDDFVIQSPFPPSKHIIPAKAENEKIPIIVYDDELSSIIAYTLASKEYEEQLQEMKANINSAFSLNRDSQTSSPLLKRRQASRQPSENLCVSDNTSIGEDSNSNQDNEKGSSKSGSKLSNFHLEIQFNDSSARFYCRVYYAEQFRKLRHLLFHEGEERFIRSLSHCIPWVARGGKSGSTFCKTQDDRFILKQMQKLELQSFLDLAPSYFQYINEAFLEQRPTLLAKIVGVFRIGFKNTVTNAASKMDLLVMENLFYGCNIKRKYDLKGSVRNRLVNTSGLQEDDIVLLDENLLKMTCDNPLYIRAHSKSVLTTAIDHDTQFLSSQSIMDYSLLVGLNEQKNELVVGIIDYIRTFTWDKKVEMFVKSSGILGGHGKMPTVVSPEMYRMRFREAMDGYFSCVPNRWTNLGMGVNI